jgi:hypothetical protein
VTQKWLRKIWRNRWGGRWHDRTSSSSTLPRSTQMNESYGNYRVSFVNARNNVCVYSLSMVFICWQCMIHLSLSQLHSLVKPVYMSPSLYCKQHIQYSLYSCLSACVISINLEKQPVCISPCLFVKQAVAKDAKSDKSSAVWGKVGLWGSVQGSERNNCKQKGTWLLISRHSHHISHTDHL